MMAGAGREFREAKGRRGVTKPHRTQFPANRLAAERYAEFLAQPLDKIGKPPADNDNPIRVRSGLNRLSKCFALRVGLVARPASGFGIAQTIGAISIEAHHPVPDDLQANPADPCRLPPAAAPS